MPFLGDDQVAAERRCVDEGASGGFDDQVGTVPSTGDRAVDADPTEEGGGPRNTVPGRSRQQMPLADGLLSVQRPTVVRRVERLDAEG